MASRQVEITPASLGQVTSTDKGRLVAITDDVGGVAQQLLELDEHLRLAYDPDQAYFVVSRHLPQEDGSVEEQLVTTAQELDGRLVHRIREIGSEDYDYGAELDRIDAVAAKRHDHEQSEKLGPHAEKLSHAIRKDLGISDRIYVP